MVLRRSVLRDVLVKEDEARSENLMASRWAGKGTNARRRDEAVFDHTARRDNDAGVPFPAPTRKRVTPGGTEEVSNRGIPRLEASAHLCCRDGSAGHQDPRLAVAPSI